MNLTPLTLLRARTAHVLSHSLSLDTTTMDPNEYTAECLEPEQSNKALRTEITELQNELQSCKKKLYDHEWRENQALKSTIFDQIDSTTALEQRIHQQSRLLEQQESNHKRALHQAEPELSKLRNSTAKLTADHAEDIKEWQMTAVAMSMTIMDLAKDHRNLRTLVKAGIDAQTNSKWHKKSFSLMPD
jgi:Cu/Ag efflux protein CusF